MATRTRTSAALAVALGLAAIVSPSSAPADVVMPPPTDCPRGEVAVTSHAGLGCVKEAPKDCPAGWRGVQGGKCRLAPCETDASCQDGEACVEHAVCLEPFLDEYYDYGEERREKQGVRGPTEGSRRRAPALMAEPLPAKTMRQRPIVRYSATNVCSREVTCGAPATCQKEKLCAPKGRRALAYRGKNVDPARVARQTETPLEASAADATEASADLPTAGPGARGCGACAAGSRAADGAWVAGAAAAIGLAMRHRRSRRARQGGPSPGP